MPLMTRAELALLGQYVVVRTERGNELIKRDPRQMPRRLRVLLLAIDGAQPVLLYTQTLKGFGDVSELLLELVNLGMVRLVEPSLARQAKVTGVSDQVMALEGMLDDSRFDSVSAADVLYGATARGSFDEMVRVAQLDHPDFQPGRSASPALLPPEEQKIQIQSLFDLLEAVRGERTNLKQQIVKLNRIKAAANRLHNQNQRLQTWVYALGAACALLATSLGFVIFQR
jgi:hypothetical protein